MDDDDREAVSVCNDPAIGQGAVLYGIEYCTFYVGSNGYITFTRGDSDFSESLRDHFDLPRISALFTDLDPSTNGLINWRQLIDRVAVTYLGVPETGESDINTFQIEMFFDGRIQISYLDLSATGGIAGLSAGTDLPGRIPRNQPLRRGLQL